MATVTVRDEMGTVSYKSWAQQTEESYQLQLALALRLSSEATCVDYPNFLDPGADERSASAEVLSHRFWIMELITGGNFGSKG
ncbi:unnamed protein product [Ilex paraguariensis]|uniref:Uncharacterized protein n=1 Tax=Ilex paraguariensis TaxID=185542 RepID=A0ABC8S9X8_9AQUA